MCGIFGYAHFECPMKSREIVNLLIQGLKRLEYRGYDSAGVCIDGVVNGINKSVLPIVIRRAGNVDSLKSMIDKNNANIDFEATVEASVSISHTRWATHGEPCERNAHPLSSADGEFYICHNGIMTNFKEVKTYLIESHGYKFMSDTDSEVIAQLFHYLYHKHLTTYNGDASKVKFLELVLEAMGLIQGAYAILVKSPLFPNEMIGVKKGSPLIVGLSDEVENNNAALLKTCSNHKEIFVSSDVNSLAEHTKKVVYMEDEDLFQYSNGSISFFNRAKMDCTIPAESRAGMDIIISELEMALESMSKGNYPHFMLKEIFEQPESCMSSMRGRINFETTEVKLGGFNSKKGIFHHARRIVFVSCGTSLNACFAVRPLFDELAQLPIMVENASDFLDRNPFVCRSDVYIFVSQSGETADTIRALEYCRENGAILVGVTNVVASSISRLSHFGCHLNCGVEIGVASTKAYTAQYILLTLIALLLSEDSVILQPRRRAIVEGLKDLTSLMSECLKKVDKQIIEVARKLNDSKSVLVLGRGYQFATCMEAALKIKELTYVHTEGINSGELKHGPLALIDENVRVIMLCTKDSHIDGARSALQQIAARKGRPICIVSDDDAEIFEAASEVIKVPQTIDCLQGIINILPLQLLSYYMAVQRGNNVDFPRNLAKSVTVQ
eukprot:Tbor_TRINITY_DN4364_c0_g1::TRINITY_DN4364_c0_g1_i2::g.7836::m.7836/K00820/glmS, GFPT; glucosamine--fructose-6-phosphate aminotransferase (isomerizing)